MDFEKDSFELELEKENEGYELVLNETEETTEKSKIRRIKKIPKVKPEIQIDFAKSELSLYAIIPKIKLTEAGEKEKKKGFEQVEILEYMKTLAFRKKYSFTNNQVVVDNKTYPIPNYFNMSLILKNDANTWEMLFYKIYYSKIISELKKYGL